MVLAARGDARARSRAGRGGSARRRSCGARSRRRRLPGARPASASTSRSACLDRPLAAVARPARRACGAGDDHEVVARRGSSSALGPESLPEQALDAVALDGAADLAAHGDARAADPARRRPRAGRRRRRGAGSRASGPRGRRGRTRRCATAGGACGARGRPSAYGVSRLRPLSRRRLSSRAARARAHARAEAVGACALALLGLVGALHRGSVAPEPRQAVQDRPGRARSLPRRQASTVFPRFAAPASGAPGRRSSSVPLYTRRRRGRRG